MNSTQNTFFASSPDELRLTSGRPVWIKTGNRDQPDVRWEQTGNWVAYLLDDSDKYRLMSLSDFHEDGDVPVELRSISSTGRRLGLSLKTQSGWVVRDPSSGEQSLPFGLDWAPGCDPVFSPNDRLLAWGTLDSQVIVADLNMVARKLNELRK